MKNTAYELIIIGGGPAGCSAAVYAGRKQVKTLLATYEFGGQSIVSDDIQNWISVPHIKGSDLAKNLKNHVLEYTGEYVTIKEGTKVTNIKRNNDNTFSVFFDDNTEVQTIALLITAGSVRRRLSIVGADRLEHKGLTYCASCDGPLFSGMDVIVVGGGNAAFETAAQLLAYCKSVTLVNRSDSFRADKITIEKLSQNPKLTILKNIEMLEILGEKFVSGMKIKHIDTEKEETLFAMGIFVEIGQIPNTEFLDSNTLLDIDNVGKIIIDPWTQKTSQEGIWAAGDVTNIRYHQNNIASGDGVKALEDIYQWLQKNKS